MILTGIYLGLDLNNLNIPVEQRKTNQIDTLQVT